MTDPSKMPDLLAKAETLVEALPYLQRYAGETFVIKYGGHAMGDPEAQRDFAEDVVLLKAVGINPVVVHGGGPQIGAMLKQLGIESTFVGGLRVTDAATAEVAEMVLAGKINKEIVSWVAALGGRAVGISGKDANLVLAEKVSRTEPDPNSGIERHVDLGFVGEPVAVDPTILVNLTNDNFIPVVAPVALGADGATYNINADTMAGAIAGAQSDGERGLVLETHRVTSGDLVDTTQPVTNGVGVQEQFAGGVDERPVGGQEGPKSTHVLGAPVVVQALEWVDELVLERGQPAQGQALEQAVEGAQLIGSDASAVLLGQVEGDAGLGDRRPQFGERYGCGVPRRHREFGGGLSAGAGLKNQTNLGRIADQGIRKRHRQHGAGPGRPGRAGQFR